MKMKMGKMEKKEEKKKKKKHSGWDSRFCFVCQFINMYSFPHSVHLYIS